MAYGHYKLMILKRTINVENEKNSYDTLIILLKIYSSG